MTIDEAIEHVKGLVQVDPFTKLEVGDLDEFYCDAVDDTDGKRWLVWVTHTVAKNSTVRKLERFSDETKALAYAAILCVKTGARLLL